MSSVFVSSVFVSGVFVIWPFLCNEFGQNLE